MLSKSISEEKDENKLIRCENCRQDILANKMFLHEGFCHRNNVFCEHCEEVYLKEEYKEHIEELKKNLTTKKVEYYSDSKKSTSNEEENSPIEHTITTVIPNPTIEYIQMPLVEQISINKPIIISADGQIVSNKNKNEYLLSYLGITPRENNFFSKEEFLYRENQFFQNYPYIEMQTQNQIYPMEQYNDIYNNIIGYNEFYIDNTMKRNNTEIFNKNRNIELNIYDEINDLNIINNNLINYNNCITYNNKENEKEYNSNYVTYNNNGNIKEYNNKKENIIQDYFKKEKIQRREFNSEDKVYKKIKNIIALKINILEKLYLIKLLKKAQKIEQINYIIIYLLMIKNQLIKNINF